MGFTFAGIDVSTQAIDVVLLNLDDDHADWRTYDLGAGDALARVRRIPRVLPPSHAWADSGVRQIQIEQPMSAAYKSAIPLAWASAPSSQASPQTGRCRSSCFSRPSGRSGRSEAASPAKATRRKTPSATGPATTGPTRPRTPHRTPGTHSP